MESAEALDLSIKGRPAPFNNDDRSPRLDQVPASFPSPESMSSSSSPPLTTHNDVTAPARAKATRPFKAYVRDPLHFGLTAHNVQFEEFRQQYLNQVQTTEGTNTNMRRTSQNAQHLNGDPNYLEKRRKNNEAAKRSRDARRKKEDEIAIRCAFLENRYLQLKTETTNNDQELKRLRQILYLQV